MNKKFYNRKHRHRANSKLRNSKSVRKHTKLSGRTGGIWKKKNHSTKRFGFKVVIPNQPTFYFPALTP